MTNSNTKNSLLRLPANFRETFGILKRDGTKYKDIIGAFLVARPVKLEELEQGFLRPSPSDQIYAIHTDYETLAHIVDNKKADCVISFQRRTTGNYAMVRLYKTELLKNKELV